MHVGGVEKSLTSLLNTLSPEKYEIHVGLVLPEGDLLPLLPSGVSLHPITDISQHWDELKQPPLITIKRYFASGKLLKTIVATMVYLQCKLRRSSYWWVDYILKNVRGIEETYDIAVAYAGPGLDIDYYICHKVKAFQKIGWVHFDISKFGIDKFATQLLYTHYNRIYIVSEEGKDIFDMTYPEFREKTEVYHNVVQTNLVQDQANQGESFYDNYDGKRILTVGRISPEKGQRVAIQALRELIGKGYNVRWYFVGDGADLEYCKNLADGMGLSESIVFLGTKTNPYAFMRDCDVYVQPSRHEGFCITLAEALCFDNPIVSTDFTGAKEQLKDCNNCIVVGMDANDISKGIEMMLNQVS